MRVSISGIVWWFVKVAIAIVIVYYIAKKFAADEIKDLRSNNEAYKELVGEKIVLSKDTLIIIDYSILNSTLELEDGRTVNVNVYNDLALNKDEYNFKKYNESNGTEYQESETETYDSGTEYY